ncbi:transcriptional regulator [Streptomyces subrutilus]|uniref:Transcriptional regulator n=1 Tax=Streptomyces subrutilus TaxID=36818 RepID=A0A918RJ19_9ACTN|nr:helix-turn-helix transcriptional regulator [Streptomyces subrutilus]GGZ98965.1 transcriptional regulator [Streptomyces subrutilus]
MGARPRPFEIVGGSGLGRTSEPAPSAPPILRNLLGAALQRHRTAAGLTQPQVVERGGISSASKLCRIENGATNVRFDEKDIVKLLNLYGVPDGEERESVIARVHQILAVGKPRLPGSKGMAAAFNELRYVEAVASKIVTFEANHVPGLLQTTAYMNAVFAVPDLGRETAGHSSRVELRREVRTQRQQILEGSSAPEFTAIIDEAALRRPIGGRAVMLEQLRRIYGRCERGGNVHVRVFPTEAWAHCPPLTTAMTLLKLSEPEGPPEMVYVEATNISAMWVEDQVRLIEHKASLEGVFKYSLTKANTMRFLQARIDELAEPG